MDRNFRNMVGEATQEFGSRTANLGMARYPYSHQVLIEHEPRNGEPELLAQEFFPTADEALEKVRQVVGLLLDRIHVQSPKEAVAHFAAQRVGIYVIGPGIPADYSALTVIGDMALDRICARVADSIAEHGHPWGRGGKSQFLQADYRYGQEGDSN